MDLWNLTGRSQQYVGLLGIPWAVIYNVLVYKVVKAQGDMQFKLKQPFQRLV